MDSNSVSAQSVSRELPAGEQPQRPDVRLRARYPARRAGAFRERRSSDVVVPIQRVQRAASQPLRALARAQWEPRDAQALWQQRAPEQPWPVPLAAAQPRVSAPREQAAEQPRRAWLRLLAARSAAVRQRRARTAEQPLPAARREEPRPRASCGPRGRRPLSRPYRPRPSVPRQPRHRQQRENARALL